MTRALRFSIALLLAPLATACTDDGGGGLNLFTVDDDIELGQQIRDELAADPATYPILDESEAPEAYAHLYDMRDVILDTGEVTYADEFDWELYIIDDDDTLNAFCAPGGYIYVYTGLLHYLDYEDELEGVLAHEMAHADKRHSTEQLTKAYGVYGLLALLTGNDPGLVGEIAAGLVSLSFSRTDEAEADEYSVHYLCDTLYASDGAAGFFEKLLDEDGGEVPEFVSSHPSSESRVEDIRALAEELGCPTDLHPHADYDAFLDSLP